MHALRICPAGSERQVASVRNTVPGGCFFCGGADAGGRKGDVGSRPVCRSMRRDEAARSGVQRRSAGRAREESTGAGETRGVPGRDVRGQVLKDEGGARRGAGRKKSANAFEKSRRGGVQKKRGRKPSAAPGVGIVFCGSVTPVRRRLRRAWRRSRSRRRCVRWALPVQRRTCRQGSFPKFPCSAPWLPQ